MQSHIPDHRPVVLMGNAMLSWLTSRLDDFDLRLADDACEACQSARVAIAASATIDDLFFDRFPAVDYVAAVGSGHENIDIAAARRRGIAVTCNAAGPSEDVADHTVALLLAHHHNLIANDRLIRANAWPIPAQRRSLPEMRVGIVGLGLIGRAIARRLAIFGCDIRWTGPRRKDAAYAYVPDLIDLADWSDILVIAARADSTNVDLIGATVLEALGPTGLLINISRGSIVDEDVLIAMLRDGRLGGAALDVFKSEPTSGEKWRDVPRTLLTPHMSGYASATQRNLQNGLAANISAYFSGEPLTGRIA